MTTIQGKIRIGLRLLFGLIFLGAGGAKLLGAPMMVQEFALFEPYGIGQWFRYLTGALEVLGVLLLVRASTVFYGALLPIIVSVGALVAQASVIHQDVIHPILFAALLGWTAWGYRPGMVR